ncbi:MAG: pyrroloquinoline quinone-dependent dehydrogenase [Acidobacteriota bacterium]
MSRPVRDPFPVRSPIRGRIPLLAVLLLVLLPVACEPGGEADGDGEAGRDVSSREPVVDFAPSADWATYGGDPGQRRFTRLPGLDAEAAGRMERAWSVGTGVPGIFEATPVAVGGRLYVSTPTRGGEQRVLKLDGATGERVWERRIEIGSARPEPTRTSRGVAVGGGRVYLATLDARLIALDTADGADLWETRTSDPSAGYQHKQAPLFRDGRVYLGVSGGPLGIRGFVKAFDAETGRELWTWHSIPSPEQGGWWGEWVDTLPGTSVPLHRELERERADSARYADSWRRGGGAVWMTPTLDPERGLLFVSVGNPAPELTDRSRPGDNRWTSSVCALRTEDGSRAWCRQIVPHDVWGMDAASPPFLLTHGDTIPAVGHFSKLGTLYVWDRRDGRLLTVSESYVPRENFLARPTTEGVRMAPGLYGGTEWSPGSYSPRTGLAYTAALHAPGRYFVRTRGPREGTTGFDLGPADERWGVLAAVDPTTGRVAWTDRTERPMVAGSLVTAGDVVFAGLLSGGLAAWDARTGERLWTGPAEFPCASAPAAYQADGRPFVALACGGHFLAGGGTGDQVVAFTPSVGEAGGD